MFDMNPESVYAHIYNEYSSSPLCRVGFCIFPLGFGIPCRFLGKHSLSLLGILNRTGQVLTLDAIGASRQAAPQVAGARQRNGATEIWACQSCFTCSAS